MSRNYIRQCDTYRFHQRHYSCSITTAAAMAPGAPVAAEPEWRDTEMRADSVTGLASRLLQDSARCLAAAVLLYGTVMFAAPRLARADVISEVNDALLNIVQNTSASLIDGPPEVAREIAMVDGAVFDAVNAASGSPYAPMAYHGSAVAGASPEAAALEAAVTVMTNLYDGSSLYQQYDGVTGAVYYGPHGPDPNPAAAAAYAKQPVGPSAKQMTDVGLQISGIVADLTDLGSGSSITAGIALGTAAGDAMIASRANDGSKAAMLQTLTPYVPANEGQPGVYVPPTGRPAMTPTWGTVAPFGMSTKTLNALESTVPAPPAVNSQAYALQVLQTECEGSGTALPTAIESVCEKSGFSPESSPEAAAALFWNDPGTTFTPPGHWLEIADSVAAGQSLGLLQHAREDALVGEALSDAGSATWAVKYKYNLWRPVTAIHDCNDWNPYFTTCDAAWSSLINTPPHPDYVAGHPAFSGAVATVLAAFFGTDNIAFSSTSDAYCNGGASVTDAYGNVIGCTQNGTLYSVSTPGAHGCNNAPTQYGGYAVTSPNYNKSPLICPITLNFTSFSQASAGYLGAEFSRVVGGIHTPMAVENALALGDSVGEELVPEPPVVLVLASGLVSLGLVRRRKKNCVERYVGQRGRGLSAHR